MIKQILNSLKISFHEVPPICREERRHISASSIYKDIMFLEEKEYFIRTESEDDESSNPRARFIINRESDLIDYFFEYIGIQYDIAFPPNEDLRLELRDILSIGQFTPENILYFEAQLDLEGEEVVEMALQRTTIEGFDTPVRLKINFKTGEVLQGDFALIKKQI